MTNPSIPPCPVCGTVPKSEYLFIRVSCGCIMHKDTEVVDTLYCRKVFEYLGRAISAHGITTIAQLNERLAPDPRVAVLEARAYELFHSLDPACEYSGVFLRYKLNDLTADIETTEPNKLIAAQRGEG